jgi:hypothetical protein
MKARWIRLGRLDLIGFEEAVAHLAGAQQSGAAPILAWAEREGEFLFALIAPRKYAPGRARRWLAWALAPAVATYRQYGMPAYLEGESIALHGATIANATVRSIGECAVIASSFLARWPSRELEDVFRLRLEAQHGWQFDHSWPSAPETVRYAVA